MKTKLAIEISQECGLCYFAKNIDLDLIPRFRKTLDRFGRGCCVFPGDGDPIFSIKLSRLGALIVGCITPRGGVDLGRDFPPRAQSQRVVLSTMMDARQCLNQRETAFQHCRLQNEADVTMTECSDLHQIEWLVGQR